MKHIPNLLSCLRIALAISLPFLSGEWGIFLIVYCACGLSDALDGFIARRYHVESRVGMKLDSLGDFIFYVCAAFILIQYINMAWDWIATLLLGFVVMARLINFIITGVKFKQWGMLHSIGNKAAGLLLFLSIPIFVAAKGLPIAIIIPLAIVSIVSALEETGILFVLKEYNPNCKSILHARRR